MRISEWSVAARLTFAFSAIGVLLLATLLVAWTNFNSAAHSVDELANDRMPKVEFANFVIDDLNKIARGAYLQLIASDSRLQSDMASQIKDAQERLTKNMAYLKERVNKPRGIELFGELEAKLAQLNKTTETIESLVFEQQVEAAKTASLSEFRNILNETIVVADTFISYQTDVAREEGVKTNERIVSSKWLVAMIALASLAVSLLFGYFITRSLLREMGAEPSDLSAVASAIATGNFDLDLVIKNDAKGNLASTMMQMRDKLKAADLLATENTRVRAALDTVSSNVMIADNDRNIIYLNSSVIAMLSRNETEIRKALPNFNAKTLIGNNIDVFHKNPGHQGHLLARLTTSYSANIKIAELHFKLTANPVFDASGARLGSVVEWVDETASVNIQDEINRMISATSKGDFTTRLQLDDKEGFYRDLAEGINSMAATTANVLNDIAQVMDNLESGNLTSRMEGSYEGTFAEIKENINSTMNRLSFVVQSIHEASQTISSATSQLSAGNTDLSSRTEEQASSLEETASSMEELSSTVKQNSENAREADEKARSASEQAQRGGEVVQSVVSTMQTINESAKKIADIISVIDGIAFQTNILALNAAVEAARAGEQGRGFAVVAGEVRNLAQRSASAAKEIKTLIDASLSNVEQGNKLVANAGSTMTDVVGSIGAVADLMRDIYSASQEQARGISQVETAITQIDETTQHNAALVEESAATAESMAEQAQLLAECVAQFTLAAEVATPKRQNIVTAQSKATAVKSRRTIATPRKTGKKPLPPLPEGMDDDWTEF